MQGFPREEGADIYGNDAVMRDPRKAKVFRPKR